MVKKAKIHPQSPKRWITRGSIFILLCLCVAISSLGILTILLFPPTLAPVLPLRGENIAFSGAEEIDYLYSGYLKVVSPIGIVKSLPIDFYDEEIRYLQFSPNGKLIAYYSPRCPASCGDLRVIGVDGRDDKMLLEDKLDYENYSWSPDSTEIVAGFCPNWCNRLEREIVGINVDNGKIIFSVSGRRPNFSADGTKIIFIGSESNDVYVMDANGDNIRALGMTSNYAVWSHDGKKIALLQENLIRIINQDDLSTIITIDENTESWRNSAKWSPNDKYLLVTGDYLRIFDTKTGEIFDTLVKASRETSGAWSPNSKRIIYPDPAKGLAIYNLSTKEHQYLNLDGYYPDWSLR